MSHFGLLTLLVILCSLNQAASEVYYITTKTSDHCTMQPCLTLSQFAANLSHYLLFFLPGTHYLSKVNLTLTNVENFMMKSRSSTAQLKCTNDSSMHFSQSQRIHITNLEFIGCGDNQVKHVKEFLVDNAKFKGQENSGTALDLIGTTAQIVNSTFVSNRKGSYRQFAVFLPWYNGGTRDGFIGGTIIATNGTNIHISQSKFENNSADYGAAIFADNSIINITGNVSFINNAANDYGGVLYSNRSAVTTINASTFNNNLADKGGVLWSFNSTVTIATSEFHDNSGGVLTSINSSISIEASEFRNTLGGVLYSDQWSTITIEASEFNSNTAFAGGVLCLTISNITIEESEFDGNSASDSGGVLYSESSTITAGDCKFTNNSSPIGAVIYPRSTKIYYHHYFLIDNNLADDYAVIYLGGSEFRGYNSGNFSFLKNFGSLLVAFNSNMSFSGYAEFENNQPSRTTTGAFQEGGAITLFYSNIYFNGQCNLQHNRAENGGAIHSTDTKLYVNGNVSIAHNNATRNGGGVYLSTSELNCQQESTFVLYNNSAAYKGGGLHAVSSSIKAIYKVEFFDEYNCRVSSCYIGTRINFTNNTVKLGGGLSLEANAKLNIQKYYDSVNDFNTVIFTGNSAHYGGAVYVDDDTISGTCTSDPKTECFFQVLAVYFYVLLKC